ncbi:LptF/LptG family permease, partial [Glaciimonas sp. CA11.2]
PMMALCLMLLAIPLSFVNPRVGRSASLIIALLLFVTYSNMVSFFQATVVQGRLSFLTALWPVHVVVLGLILFLFSWRLKVNSRYHPLVVWSAIKHARILKKSAAS